MGKVDQRIAELDTYFQEYGHSDVPNNYPPNQSLANWVRNVRSNYAIQKATNGKMKVLNKNQVKKMVEVNFSFRVHNFKRAKFEKFETLSKLICAYEGEYPFPTSRVDFNSRTADLPEKYSRLPELCADIQTADLSKVCTKVLKKMGVKFSSSTLRPASNVGTTGNQFVIFEDPPAERRTTNLAADSTNGNPPSPLFNPHEITHSSCNLSDPPAERRTTNLAAEDSTNGNPPSPLFNPHDITHSSCNLSDLSTVSPPENENIIELVEKIGTVVLDDITNKVKESSPPEELSVRRDNSKTGKKAAALSAPKVPTRASTRPRKPRTQTNL